MSLKITDRDASDLRRILTETVEEIADGVSPLRPFRLVDLSLDAEANCLSVSVERDDRSISFLIRGDELPAAVGTGMGGDPKMSITIAAQNLGTILQNELQYALRHNLSVVETP